MCVVHCLFFSISEEFGFSLSTQQRLTMELWWNILMIFLDHDIFITEFSKEPFERIFIVKEIIIS